MDRPHYGRASHLAVSFTLVLVLALGLVPAAGAAQEAELEDLEGSGTSADPYVITSAEELRAMEQDLEAHYELGGDIDASATADWNDGDGFTPVAGYNNRFEGTLDGQGHVITGLTIDRPESLYVGLFATIEGGGTVRNVQLHDAEIDAGANVGVLAGLSSGTVSNVVVADSEVVGGGGRIGGVVGQADEATMSQLAAVNVSVHAGQQGGGVVGGLYDGSQLTAAFASGDVFSEENAGGIAGVYGGPIRDAVSTASVSGSGAIGGLVGSTRGDRIETSFAAGEVEVGGSGFVGDGGSSHITDSYWDEDATGQSSAAGSGSVDAEAVSTAEATGPGATDALSALDFDSTFQVTDEYPVHQWRVEGLELAVANAAVGEGQTTELDVRLQLAGGTTVPASQVASYDSETAIATVDDGTVEAVNQGVTEIEASVLGYSDTVEVEVLEPPSIELRDASLLAPGVAEGSETAVDATFENTGGPGSETVTLTVDGETVLERSVRVEPGETRLVPLTWTPETGGAVALNGTAVGDLQIVDADAVRLEGVSVPERVGAGGTYDITVELSSDAAVTTAQVVEVRSGGERVVRHPAAATPDGSTVTVQHATDEQGPATAVAEVGEQQATATVEVVEPIDLAVESVDVPDSAAVDEPVTVTATVSNDGGPGGATVAFSLDGETVHEASVDLERGASTTVSANLTPTAAGERTVAVAAADASQSATLAVDDASSGDGSGGGGGLPGGALAVAAVLVAVVAVAALRFR